MSDNKHELLLLHYRKCCILSLEAAEAVLYEQTCPILHSAFMVTTSHPSLIMSDVGQFTSEFLPLSQSKICISSCDYNRDFLHGQKCCILFCEHNGCTLTSFQGHGYKLLLRFDNGSNWNVNA